MYHKDHVAALASALGEYKIDPPVELGTPDAFGLGLELFDPVSGQIITVARPARTDLSQSEILLTPMQVAQAVTSARMNRLHQVRAAGFASLQAADEAAQRNVEAMLLADKQAAERAALAEQHAEATAAAALAAQPKGHAEAAALAGKQANELAAMRAKHAEETTAAAAQGKSAAEMAALKTRQDGEMQKLQADHAEATNKAAAAAKVSPAPDDRRQAGETWRGNEQVGADGLTDAQRQAGVRPYTPPQGDPTRYQQRPV